MMWKKRDWDAEKRGEGGETWRQFEGIMQKNKKTSQCLLKRKHVSSPSMNSQEKPMLDFFTLFSLSDSLCWDTPFWKSALYHVKKD